MNCKVSVFFGWKKQGWVETHFWQGGNSGLADCETDAKRLVRLRKRVMAPEAQVEAVRIQTCNAAGATIQSGVSELLYKSAEIGRGSLEGSPDVPDVRGTRPWLTLFITMYSLDLQYRAAQTLRGIDASYCCIEPTDANTFFIPPTKLNEPLRNYLSYLRNDDVKDGGVLLTHSGQWSMRVTSKPLGRNASKPIAGAKVDPSTFALNIKPAGGATFSVGQKIHLHGLKSTGLTGLNGNVRIVGPVGTAGELAGYYPTSKQTSPACGIDTQVGATWWNVSNVLVANDNYVLARVTRKSTGAAYFGTSGRASKRRRP